MVDQIGSGSFGNVFRAFDPMLQREVAIKVPSANIRSSALKTMVEGFKHEATIAARFIHPNVVAVHDLGSFDTELDPDLISVIPHFLVMEFVKGVDLSDYIKEKGKRSLQEALEITYQCCKALDYIHYNGVIHRDIKPGNILYNPDRNVVKIMDFSISEDISFPSETFKGTPRYMAPEHFQDGSKVSARTDIFALGSVMYELLAGKPAFSGSSHSALAAQIMSANPEPISEIRPDIDPVIDNILARAMHKNPEERYQNALEFAAAFSQITPDETGETPVDDSMSRTSAQLLLEINQYINFRETAWFRDYSPDQINHLLCSASIENYHEGDVIIAEGEQSSDVFTLIEGNLNIHRKNQLIGSLKHGESFGELAFISPEGIRMATIASAGESTVLKIHPEDIQNLPKDMQSRLYQSFLEVTLQRLIKHTDEVAEIRAILVQ